MKNSQSVKDELKSRSVGKKFIYPGKISARNPTDTALIGYQSKDEPIPEEKFKPSKKNLNSVNFATQAPVSRKKPFTPSEFDSQIKIDAPLEKYERKYKAHKKE